MLRSLFRRFGFVSLSFGLVAFGALLHAACEDVTAKGLATPNQKPEELAQALATIDDVTITVGDFQDRINKQSAYVRARYTSLERKKEFLDNLVRFEVLAREAERKGLDKDPEVVRTMKQALIQKLMKDQFENKVKIEDVTDAECKAFYDSHLAEFNQPEEVRAAMVLVKDLATAKKVAADPRIKGSSDVADFRKLVAEFSIDAATKDRGGDLRYFDASSKELPAPIISAVFALSAIGDVSPPVKTPQGIAILKLTGRHKAVARPFDDAAKAQIRNRVFRDKRQAAMDAYIKDLQTKAKVQIHEERLARVVIEGAQPGEVVGPGGPPSPARIDFHPNGQGAPHAGPLTPLPPPGTNEITVPGPAHPAPPPPAPATLPTPQP